MVNVLCLARSLPADFTYGSKPTLQEPRDALPGVGSSRDQTGDSIDVSLGKSVREGWKNAAPSDRVSICLCDAQASECQCKPDAVFRAWLQCGTHIQ